MGYQDENSTSIVFDVETIAAPDVELILGPVRVPANYKDPAKIAAFQTDKLAEKILTASLEPDLCEVVAVGMQRPDGECDVVTRREGDELILLDWFWGQVQSGRLVGFNILSFDLPVLIRRSQLLGLDVPYVNLDRYRTPHIDLLDKLSFQGRIPYRSLSFYCRRFGIDCVDTVAGADIPGLVAEGEWDAVKEHCASDVQKTAKLAARLGYFRLPVESVL